MAKMIISSIGNNNRIPQCDDFASNYLIRGKPNTLEEFVGKKEINAGD